MSSIIGETLIYTLEDAIKRQEKLNQTLFNSESETTSLLKEQTELLEQLLSLCRRAF
jgi:hypothetical protein